MLKTFRTMALKLEEFFTFVAAQILGNSKSLIFHGFCPH